MTAWEILQHRNTPQRTAPPDPQPKPWDPTTFHAPPTRSVANTQTVEAPPVPDNSGKTGHTVVDTPSMELFSGNMTKLAEPVQKAYEMLLKMPSVNPGSFFDAYNLRQATSGDTGDQGIQATYLKILHGLGQGLADIGSGTRQLSQKYSTIEEENKMSADEVQEALAPALGDFGKLSSG